MISLINEAINRKLASISFTTIISGLVVSTDPLQIKINDRITIGLDFIEPSSLGISDNSPSSALSFIVGEKVQMIRYNNGQRFYLLTSATPGVTDYNELENKPILNTSNSTAQAVNSTEEIKGTLKLHKISKTGSYNDLLNKPNKASGDEINTGIDDLKYVTSKAITDSNLLFESQLATLVDAIILNKHPIGSLEFNITGTNPGTYLGGTWVAWGSGRVPVGVDTSQTEFNTVEKTGGAKTHTHTYSHTHRVPGVAHTHSTSNHKLTVAEMPNHTHNINREFPAEGMVIMSNVPHHDSYNVNVSQGYSGSNRRVNSVSDPPLTSIGGGQAHNHGNTGSTTPSATTTNSQSTTNTSSTSNVQPYICVYMWKRIS